MQQKLKKLKSSPALLAQALLVQSVFGEETFNSLEVILPQKKKNSDNKKIMPQSKKGVYLCHLVK